MESIFLSNLCDLFQVQSHIEECWKCYEDSTIAVFAFWVFNNMGRTHL